VVAAYNGGTALRPSTSCACVCRGWASHPGDPDRLGLEFKRKFERACEALGIILYVLPRAAPLDGRSSGRTDPQEEFYDLVEVPDDLVVHNTRTGEHEAVYNGFAPTRPGLFTR